MPKYSEYLSYAKAKGFQPISENVFNSLIGAGINPIPLQYQQFTFDTIP